MWPQDVPKSKGGQGGQGENEKLFFWLLLECALAARGYASLELVFEYLP